MLDLIQKKIYGICKALLFVPSAAMTFGFVFAVKIKKTCVRYGAVLVFVWHTVGGRPNVWYNRIEQVGTQCYVGGYMPSWAKSYNMDNIHHYGQL